MNRHSRDVKASRRPLPVQVAILLPQRLWAGSVFLARDLLQAAGTLGAHSADVGASAIFNVRLVGASMAAVASFGGLRIRPEASVASTRSVASSADRFDVVIVPAQFAPVGEMSVEDERFGVWLVRQHEQGAVLLSLGGAALLAKSGLLDHREATGLVSEREMFRRFFPRVRYLPSRRVIASDDIITVCGISPTVDACAHLIERFFGAALARRFLRHTSTEVMPSQEHLALWTARYKRHRDGQVLAAQEIVERELHELPRLANLAARIGLSERSLSRRLAEATGLNLRRYVASARLELSEFLLRTTDMPLVHVAQECGYSSASALSHAFSMQYGKGPGRYRVEMQAPRSSR